MNTNNNISTILLAVIISLVIGIGAGYFIALKNINTEPVTANPGAEGQNIVQNITPTATTTRNTQATSTLSTPINNQTKAYVDSSFGFSTLLDQKLIKQASINETGFNYHNWSQTPIGVGSPVVFAYMVSPKSTTQAGIVVYRQDDGYPECITKLTAPGENKAGLAVYFEDVHDGAMGHFETLYKRGISNGSKSFCVIGFATESRPYNLEGNAYQEVDAINKQMAVEIKAASDIFVDNFTFIQK